MKIKLNFSKLLQGSIATLGRLSGLLVALTIVALLGYGGYLMSRVVNLQPDPSYLQQQRQSVTQSQIHFDRATIQTINGLEQVNPKVDLSNIGKTDPFVP